MHLCVQIEGDEDIRSAIVEFYKSRFSQDINTIDLSILDLIPKPIDNVDNKALMVVPTIQKVKDVALAQEIIYDIKKPNRGGNVIMKIDMNKEYDRMSSHFMCSIMKKMRFSEEWIYIVWNLISNMCYTTTLF